MAQIYVFKIKIDLLLYIKVLNLCIYYFFYTFVDIYLKTYI